MPRKKTYNEAEVLDLAMGVFWKKGYSNTSARDLQREMNINLFSIYASFKNKDGLFLESLRAYKRLNKERLLTPLSKGTSSLDIKDYFINFLEFTKENESYKGCLLINSTQDSGIEMTEEIVKIVEDFSMEIMSIFKSILSNELGSEVMIRKKANHYFTALVGLVTTAGSLNQQQIDDFLEITFTG